MIFKGIEIVVRYCRGDLQEIARGEASFQCLSCKRCYPVCLDIPDLRVFPDPYIDVAADQEKGLQVAARLDELSFAELVEFYYSITPVVPQQHARLYTRGLMAGVARAEAALTLWEKTVRTHDQPAATSLLEIGCGTAPLLVAARSRFAKLVGVDIAFRWLVVAKKRLAEVGMEIPLICACAGRCHSLTALLIVSWLTQSWNTCRINGSL